MCPAPFISGGLKPGGVHSILEGNRMSEENNLTSGADDLPPAIQKTKEQWLDEGNFLSFYAPIRSEEGLAAYEQAIRLDPTYAQAYTGKGDILYDLKRYEEALLTYEQAIALDPTSAEAYNGKAISLVFLGRNEEALAAYEQVIRLDDDEHLYSYLAYVNSSTTLATLS